MSNADGKSGGVGFGAWYSLSIFLFLFILSLMDRQIIALMVEPLKRDLGLSDTQIGLLEGFAFVLMYAVSAIPLGWALDRFSRRLIIFLGVTVWSVSCSAAGFANSFAALFLSRVGVGVGEAALTPGAQSMLSDLFPRRMLSLALSIFSIGSSIGIMISYGVGGMLIHWLTTSPELDVPILGAMHPWQAAFLIAGAPGVLLSWLVFTMREPRRRASSADTRQFFSPIVRFLKANPASLYLVFLGFAFNNMLGYTILAWTPAFLERQFGWHVAQIGWILGLSFGLAGVAATLSAGSIGSFYYRRRPDINVLGSMVALFVAAPLAVLGFTANAPVLSVAAIGAAFVLTMFTAPNSAVSMQLIAPNHLRGRLAAVYLFAANMFGQGLGPVLVGAVNDGVFRDPQKLGSSLAIVLGTASALGGVMLLLGRRAFGDAVERARLENDAHEAGATSASGAAENLN